MDDHLFRLGDHGRYVAPLALMNMQDPTPPRLTMHDILHSVSETLNLDRGILRTLWDLLVAPQTLFETYFFKDRNKYSKPTTLLMLMLAGVILSSRHCLPPSDSYSPNLFLTISASNQDELRTLNTIREYDDVLRLLLVPAASVISYLLFRKQGWHFAEHLAFNAYILAFQFFLMAVFLPLFGHDLEWVVGIAIFAYFLVTYLRCMKGSRLLTLSKASVVVVGANLIFLAIFYPLTLWVL